MNLNTSDQRLKKHTVSISTDVLKKIQRSVNKKINNLRAQGKLTKASLPTIICLFALSLFEVQAVTTFTETFDNDNANWGDVNSNPIGWNASGGADGGGYISTTRSFADIEAGSTISFRAHDEFFLPDKAGSSDGAFIGNWAADQVSLFTASVRHNSPAPVSFSARFASPFNFPGAIAVVFGPPVMPNTWTDIAFAIDPNNPAIVSYEGQNFDAVFSNIGHIQVLTGVPEGFENNPAPFTFDLDNPGITVIPEPSSSLMLIGGSALLFLRRRRS